MIFMNTVHYSDINCNARGPKIKSFKKKVFFMISTKSIIGLFTRRSKLADCEALWQLFYGNDKLVHRSSTDINKYIDGLSHEKAYISGQAWELWPHFTTSYRFCQSTRTQSSGSTNTIRSRVVNGSRTAWMFLSLRSFSGSHPEMNYWKNVEQFNR